MSKGAFPLRQLVGDIWHAALSHVSTVYFKSGNTLRHTNTTLCYKNNTVCRTLLPLCRQRWMSAAVDGRHGVESAFYKDRNIKCDKLKQLAIKYDCSVTDLKKKVKNLRSAFHREHKRITKPKIGSSPKKEKWFAYNLLTFLLDVDIPRETVLTNEGEGGLNGYFGGRGPLDQTIQELKALDGPAIRPLITQSHFPRWPDQVRGVTWYLLKHPTKGTPEYRDMIADVWMNGGPDTKPPRIIEPEEDATRDVEDQLDRLLERASTQKRRDRTVLYLNLCDRMAEAQNKYC
ncbi:hypothetical protein J6590_087261 [Homalodisca vitripennis]|nr:hypothetical protein J6590_087261 [Homalodisca vitripennis]